MKKLFNFLIEGLINLYVIQTDDGPIYIPLYYI